MEWLEKIIDSCFDEMKKSKISMMTPAVNIPSQMQDSEIQAKDDWKGWKPMRSILTSEDIYRFESQIDISLPISFRHFLMYKHFYALYVSDRNVQIPSFLPDKELRWLLDKIYNYYEPEFIIGRRYVYFADFDDYGLLCFDSNETRSNNEYPVVYINSEDLEDVHPYADNFRALLEAHPERGNDFIDYLNKFYGEGPHIYESF